MHNTLFKFEGAKAARGTPDEVLDAIWAGSSPLKAMRSYRQMTISDLAVASGLDKATILQLEIEQRPIAVVEAQALAGSLDVSADVLLANPVFKMELCAHEFAS
jgi:transcriptional regulator with XRE-family HTH domain